MNRVISYVVVLAIGIATGYALSSSPLPLTTDTPNGAGLQISIENQREDTATYSIAAGYPQFGIPQIDAKIKKAVQDRIAEFKTYPPNPSDMALPQNEFIGIFDAMYVGPDIVSVELIFSEYTGGAHPNATIEPQNFDRATGSEITLEEALALSGKTLADVATEAQAKFRADLGESFFSEGAEEKAENYGTFKIDAEKVTFIFQNYQVAPYAAGPQEISFSRVK